MSDPVTRPWRDCRVATTGPLFDRLGIFRTCPWLAVPLALGNLAAVWWGYTIYYEFQLSNSELWLRPFVPDSPNSVLTFGLALVLWQFKVRWAWLDLLAWIVNIKVGIWTVFVLLAWYDEFFSVDPVERWFLFVLHLGMVAQVFVFHRELRTARPSWIALGIVGGLVLLDVVLDYSLGIHPILPGGPHGWDSLAAVGTILITVPTIALAFALYRPTRASAQRSLRR